MARMLFLRDIDVDVQLRCRACGHGGVLPRSILERRFGPNYPVLSIAPHYRCSRCEGRDTESRPAARDRFAGTAAPPPEPSFDAPLAALQGLLASVRGSEKPAGRAAVPPPPWNGPDEPDDSLPAFRPFAVPTPAVAAGPAAVALAETDWDEGPPSAWTPASGKAVPDLEELAADGPADADARPLWEPVSLADMASRLDDRLDGHRQDVGGETAGTDEEPLDETLAAMRRFFADADLEEDAGRPVAPKPGPTDVAAARNGAGDDADHLNEDGGDEDEDEDGEGDGDDSGLPPVFSHKVFARTDFDDLDEDWDEVDVSGGDAGWAGEDADEADSSDEEPTDEDILAFAIRDPERPAAPPSKAAPAVKPVPANDGGGFDKTLAALRSMIEDAATEPKPAPIRRKTRPSAESPVPLDDPQEAGIATSHTATGHTAPGQITPAPATPGEAAPEEAPVVRSPARADRAAKAAGTPKRSAQEREIEEAMKALRDLVEEDDPLPVKPAAGSRPSFGPGGDPFDERSPEKADPPVGKKRAEADDEASPLSKTIAALRGMLELDGRRKR